MDFAKYPSITVDLERKIRSGFYRDRLPVVTELMSHYGVSKQTIINALKPLSARKMLLPQGIRGTFINKYYRHRKKRIGIVSRFTNSELLNDSAFCQDLDSIKESDGHIFELICLPQQFLSPEMDKFLPDNLHGFIFISSSLSFPAARYLQKKKIPFVSCNYAPLFAKINFVEFDTFAAIRAIVTQVTKAGYNKIALFFPGRLEGYKDYIFDQWAKIKKDFKLLFLPCDTFQFNPKKTNREIWQDFLSEIKAQRIQPQVIISWEFVSLPLPGQYLIIRNISDYLNCTSLTPPDNVLEFKAIKKDTIIQKGYELLLEQFSAPIKRTVHRIYDVKVEFMKEIPKYNSG